MDVIDNGRKKNLGICITYTHHIFCKGELNLLYRVHHIFTINLAEKD